jgi:SAM-dependent methyltransferase
MPVETYIYDDKFFKNTIEFEAASASQFVEVVLKYYQPQSIVDIGCGAGIYLREFEKKGVKELLGIDGAPAAKNEFLLAPDKLVIFDLAQKYKFKKKYDLSLCLEVAEHLREEDADVLVETIINSSDQIIFTAAVPGQGPRSIGHINEQPHEYWIEKFENKNFSYLEEQTAVMKKEMGEKGVVWWIVNNLMVFLRKKALN